jgi:hypothetical protein
MPRHGRRAAAGVSERPPAGGAERAYRGGTVALALLMCGLGFAMTVLTAVRGGGLGLILGPLFFAAGLGRLWLLARRP